MEPTQADEHALPALYMLWSLASPPRVSIPDGYELRPYRDGEEQLLHPLFAHEGWKIDDAHWQDYKDRVLPNGLFILWHTASGLPVGTAGAIHNPRGGRYYFPFGGEIAYLVVHPEHRGRGLGAALTALVLNRLLAAGYEHIWLGVQGFRLPAIRTYLKLGFIPFLHHDGLAERWKHICAQIGRPYTPDVWPTTLNKPVTGGSCRCSPCAP